MQGPINNAGTYQFGSEPRAVQGRKKYRDPNATTKSGSSTNVMWDRRVVRGNTYAAQILPAAQAERMLQERERDERKRQTLLRQQRDRELEAARSKTPEPVEGRQHADIQTDEYLEELDDRPVEKEMDTQTDAFMDRPPSPLFVPQKSGIDAETQIYEGDLFHFDLEVEPILEVLVGKTLEQSLLEVCEEDEVAAMKAHREELQQRRNAQLAEVQRMEAAEMRRIEEAARRREQEVSRLAAQRKASEKLAARKFALDFLGDLQGTVFNSLSDAGFFYDAVERDVETTFLAALQKSVASRVGDVADARSRVDSLIQSAVRRALGRAQKVRDDRAEAARLAAEAEAARIAAEEAERARLAAEEAERKRIADEMAAAAAAAAAAEAAEAAAEAEEGEEAPADGEEAEE